MFGAQFHLMRPATGVSAQGGEGVVTLSDGTEIRSRAVIIATGVSYRRLGIDALEALIGAGVYYGAAVAEAPAMTGREVFVAGAANSAGQAAVHLSRFASRVVILARGKSLSASMPGLPRVTPLRTEGPPESGQPEGRDASAVELT